MSQGYNSNISSKRIKIFEILLFLENFSLNIWWNFEESVVISFWVIPNKSFFLFCFFDDFLKLLINYFKLLHLIIQWLIHRSAQNIKLKNPILIYLQNWFYSIDFWDATSWLQTYCKLWPLFDIFDVDKLTY